jgi:hypothetical protein
MQLVKALGCKMEEEYILNNYHFNVLKLLKLKTLI